MPDIHVFTFLDDHIAELRFSAVLHLMESRVHFHHYICGLQIHHAALLINKSYIACTLASFVEIAYPLTQSINPHTIGNTT